MHFEHLKNEKLLNFPTFSLKLFHLFSLLRTHRHAAGWKKEIVGFHNKQKIRWRKVSLLTTQSWAQKCSKCSEIFLVSCCCCWKIKSELFSIVFSLFIIEHEEKKNSSLVLRGKTAGRIIIFISAKKNTQRIKRCLVEKFSCGRCTSIQSFCVQSILKRHKTNQKGYFQWWFFNYTYKRWLFAQLIKFSFETLSTATSKAYRKSY